MTQQVLDHGFVKVIDKMGSDSAVVQSARVSYGEGTTTVNNDRGLIRYLMKHEHMTPFEMCEIKFHIKCPIFVARQWMRHRTASINEYSARYSIVPDQVYNPSEWRLQSETNKQGSSDQVLPTDDIMIEQYDQTCTDAFTLYHTFINANVTREQARMILPQSTYTEFYWKIDLRNLLGFIRLRIDSHSQYEIRVFSEALANVVKEWVPLVWEAFEDYVMYGTLFSRMEMDVIKKCLCYDMTRPETMSKREWMEFMKKIE